jgi:hypothetical protein
MVEILPKACVDMLPFSSEEIASWDDSIDLSAFLVKLFEPEYVSFSDFLFKSGLSNWRKSSRVFKKNAALANTLAPPATEDQRETIPNFLRLPQFGKIAKYSIAWDGTDNAVLSEDAFFSLPHILEAGTDLEASILLSSRLFYRQALQMLRSYLESVFADLYFCVNQTEYEKWKKAEFKLPLFRVKNGLLQKLSNIGVLPSDLFLIASRLYGDLNGSIHGEERRLVNSGIFENKQAGKLFKLQRFNEWCEYFSLCVDLGIRVLRLSSNYWLGNYPKNKVICNVCHNEDIRSFQLQRSYDTISFKCCKCNSVQNISVDWAVKCGYWPKKK